MRKIKLTELIWKLPAIVWLFTIVDWKLAIIITVLTLQFKD
jgi:hypothetical protein